jgi:arylformamidase
MTAMRLFFVMILVAGLFAPGGSAIGQEAGKVRAAIAPGLVAEIHLLEPQKPKRLFAFAAARNSGGAPVLVYVHGGGWVKGDVGKVYNLPAYARSRGYLLVSIPYRPLPRNTIDGQVSDVARGISWVRSNIAAHGGDPRRIVIMGHSSGAHLVSMVAAKKQGGAIRGVVANDVQAYDLVAYYALRDASMDPVYVRAFGSNPANWVKWSPVTHVRKASGFPPFLIMHSGSNGERRRQLARAFASELKRKGTRVSLFDGARYSHGTIASSLGATNSATAALDAFLRSVYR